MNYFCAIIQVMAIKADALKDYSVFTINSFLFLTLACLLTFKNHENKSNGKICTKKTTEHSYKETNISKAGFA